MWNKVPPLIKKLPTRMDTYRKRKNKFSKMGMSTTLQCRPDTQERVSNIKLAACLISLFVYEDSLVAASSVVRLKITS